MAEVTIKLIYNLNTGKQDILIDFVSDEDALPFEHERDHRSIIEALLGQGILNPDSVGEVVINRLGQRDMSSASLDVVEQRVQVLEQKG